MNIDESNIGKNVIELKNQLFKKLEKTNHELEIKLQKPKISNGIGNYIYQNGKYEIYITPEYLNDYILSHELLHVYDNVYHKTPSLVSWSETATNTSIEIAILLSDLLSHKWIINEQSRRKILGKDEFIDSFISGVNQLTYEESEEFTSNFTLILKIYTILNDYPEYNKKLIEIINKKYPISLGYAMELLGEKINKELISPYEARKFVLRKINKFIELFYRDNKNCNFLKEEVIVRPVIRNIQMERLAETIFDIKLNYDGTYYLITTVGQQRCSPNLSPIDKKVNIAQLKDMISKIRIGELADKLPIPYFIDNRQGEWTTHNI